MKKIVVCILLSPIFWTSVYAQTINNDIYRAALKTVIEKEDATQIFIWEQHISATTFLAQRVPRQQIEMQFRPLKSITPALELRLLYSNLIGGLNPSPADTLLDKFDVTFPNVTFKGFASKELLLSEQAKTNKQAPDSPLIIGFSQIGFGVGAQQKSALLYAEVCLLNSDEYCSGEGFIFSLINNVWELQDHRTLWQGGSKSFWKM